MGNETYLTVSYFTVGLICFCLGLAAYLWLRRPLHAIFGALSQKSWGELLKRSFPLSLVLFALSSCLSVNYYGGCNPIPYKKIIEDRGYIVAKNQEQISKSLSAIAVGVSLWGFIVGLSLFVIRRDRRGRNGESSSDLPAARNSS